MTASRGLVDKVRVPTGARPWITQAACRGVDPELFYPARGESTAQAKAVCAGCPVRAECLEWALEAREKFGVIGGASERERRRMRMARKARKAVAA